MVKSTNSPTNQLIKNNVLLQKKITEMVISINKLSKKMDTIVNIFSKAAEYVEKEGIREPVAGKLTDLLEQNRQIAKGLLMLEKYVRERSSLPPSLK